MVRLRNALMAVAMAAGAVGCAHTNHSWGDYAHWSIFHCSQCDDFPTPAYGPNFSMMPGSYAGPASESSQATTRMATPTSSNVQPNNEEAVSTPPEERPITNPPAEGANPGATPPAVPPAGNP